MEDKLNGYDLSKQWFDFAFENTELITSTHTAMYLWFVELNNKMGWKPSFHSPASQTMAAIGVKSYHTYKRVFDDLVRLGCVTLVKESKNQYTACIIALAKFDKAPYKALDKALAISRAEQLQSQVQSTCNLTDSIIKQETINSKQETINISFPVAPQQEEDLRKFEEIVESVKTELLNEEKEKKVAPKKRKEVAGSKIFFNAAKEMYLQFFKEQNNTEYYFAAKDAKAIKDIEKQIEKQITDKAITILNEDSKIAGFKHFLKIAWLNGGDWIKANFSLPILNSKFSLIVSNYNTQRNGNTKSEHQSSEDRKRAERDALNHAAKQVVFAVNGQNG